MSMAGVFIVGGISSFWPRHRTLPSAPLQSPTAGPHLWAPRRRPLQHARRRPPHPRPIAQPKSNDSVDSIQLTSIPNEHHFNYIFEGSAATPTEKLLDRTNIHIRVHVLTGEGKVSNVGVTNTEGHYHVEVPVDAPYNDSIDFIVEAESSEFQRTAMVGRRITTPGDDQVIINATLPLTPATNDAVQ